MLRPRPNDLCLFQGFFASFTPRLRLNVSVKERKLVKALKMCKFERRDNIHPQPVAAASLLWPTHQHNTTEEEM